MNMLGDASLLLCAGFFFVAICYTAVGQAGATGYLALMALGGMLPAEMRTTALVLNIVASGYATARFGAAGYTTWSALRPFVLASVPLAALGGVISLNPATYRILTGVLLAIAALALLWRMRREPGQESDDAAQVAFRHAIPLGAIIGFLSGVTGVGGGILLGPALLALGWAAPRAAAGISAPFNLLNSAVALAAGSLTSAHLSAGLVAYGGSVLAGAVIGTHLSVRRMPERTVVALLAVLTAVGAFKLLIAA